MNSVPQKLLEFSWYIGQSLNNSGGVYGNFTVNGESSGIPAAGILGSFVLIGYSIDGFLIGYLGTRRRAAVDFSKGLYEEEEVKWAMEVLNDKNATPEAKHAAKEIVRTRCIYVPEKENQDPAHDAGSTDDNRGGGMR